MEEIETFEALKYRIETDVHGNKRYYNAEGQKHREYGPAVIWADGSQIWFLNGQKHRVDGPAAIYADGSQEWYTNGKLVNSMKQYQEKLNLSDEDITVLILKYRNIGLSC